MASYLLIQFVLILIVVGVAYSFVSDTKDYLINAIGGADNPYANTPLQGQMDQDSIDGGYFLLVLFKMFLIPALFVLMYWCYNYAQKPVREW